MRDTLRDSSRTSAAPSRPITAGEEITREMVSYAMPCADGQLTSGAHARYRTVYTASRDYAAGEAIVGGETVARIHDGRVRSRASVLDEMCRQNCWPAPQGTHR